MVTLIKKPVPAIPTFTVGQKVRFNTDGGDGRTCYTNHHEGTVTKVNRVNLIVEKENGYVYKVAKTAVY